MTYLIGKVLGKYELVKRIGRGGMASVFRAIDVTNERVVAIKVIAPGLAEEEGFMARFRREAKVLMGLRHPNIVPILDFGEQDGLAYIVMPYMKVGTLRERLLEGPLGPEEGSHTVSQLASALQYAHDNGVVHRDVKPSNVLIDEKGNAWLSDFGTAQVHDATLTLTGSGLIGTPTYMAPEQARGEKVTHLADEYALGVILYQITTGQLPFEADTPLALALMHAHDPLPLPRMVNENLPPAIEAVLVKALAKDPENRYSSVAELNKAFQNALQEVYDPASGSLKPGAKAPPPSAYDFIISPEYEDEEADEPKRRVPLPVLFLLLAPLCLGALWGGLRILQGTTGGEPSGAAAAMGGPTPNLQATIDALSTAVALGLGEDLSSEQIQTAVAGTLESMLNPTLEAAGEDTLTPAPVATELGTTTPSLTAVPSATIRFTPTRTRTATLASSKTPTQTLFVSPSPTRTRTVTPTPTIIKTATLPPPPTVTYSPTSTTDPCIDLSLGNFSAPSTIAKWRINNDSGSTVTLTDVSLSWPASNDLLFNVFFKGAVIWSGEGDPPSITIPPGWIGGPGARQFDSAATLEFFFGNPTAESGYNLQVTLSNGCTLSDSN